MSADHLDRYDLMQRLGNRIPKPINGRDIKHRGIKNAIEVTTWIVLGILIGIAIQKTVEEQRLPPVENPCIRCHSTKHRLTDYFKRAGNSHPEKMAEAVLATGRPRLLAAVAVAGEKNTPYTVRKGGYKKRHAGAWQVNQKYWGKVPHDPVGQALQAERILEDLTGEGKNIRTALSIYGGDSSSRYADRVMKEIQEVPM